MPDPQGARQRLVQRLTRLCGLYDRWYQGGVAMMDSGGVAYELVTGLREAIAALLEGEASPDDGGVSETERRHSADCRAQAAQRQREAHALCVGEASRGEPHVLTSPSTELQAQERVPRIDSVPSVLGDHSALASRGEPAQRDDLCTAMNEGRWRDATNILVETLNSLYRAPTPAVSLEPLPDDLADDLISALDYRVGEETMPSAAPPAISLKPFLEQLRCEDERGIYCKHRLTFASYCREVDGQWVRCPACALYAAVVLGFYLPKHLVKTVASPPSQEPR